MREIVKKAETGGRVQGAACRGQDARYTSNRSVKNRVQQAAIIVNV
jgi:hypothetical protein